MLPSIFAKRPIVEKLGAVFDDARTVYRLPSSSANGQLSIFSATFLAHDPKGGFVDVSAVQQEMKIDFSEELGKLSQRSTVFVELACEKGQET